MARRVDWACEWCGYSGSTETDEGVDTLQCTQCGEPVVPVAGGG